MLPLKVASVILDRSLKHPLDYSIPAELIPQIAIGSLVEVPLKSIVKKGTVVDIKDSTTPFPLKPIHKILADSPLLTPDLMQLALWMADYYCTPLSDIFKAMIPQAVSRQVAQKEQTWISRTASKATIAQTVAELRSKSLMQAAILESFLETNRILLAELLSKTKASQASVDALIKKGLLKKEKIAADASLTEAEYFLSKPKTLYQEQTETLNKILNSVEQNTYSTHLLFGITGSGKTEIYLQAIAKTLELERSALVLVPEIALTQQTIEQFRGRFQQTLAVLHHRLSESERHHEWKKIHRGEARIVIGARSAIFSPLQHLGLIIIDEEHDGSYKQSDRAPTYHAREAAIMRATFCKATVVLGSATPSLESYHNTQTSKYALSTLTIRPDAALLPTIRIIDMRKEYEKSKGFTIFSEELLAGIQNRCKAGEQTILFLNRRGYHTLLLCTGCGESIKCPHCDLTLTFHKNQNSLSCHLCGYALEPPPSHCPLCNTQSPLKFRGIGTEQVESALYAIFHDIKVLRLDADTTQKKGSHQKLYRAFRSGKADVLIGTQMVAKGLHFPNVTLVGVLNSDISLNIPDFRASETTFQLLTQVAGRAGRSSLPGEVLIQSCIPENTVIQNAAHQNYLQFYSEEIAVRQLFRYPPFSSLIKIRFTAKDLNQLYITADAFRTSLLTILPPDCEISPIEAPGHAKVKAQHRLQFILKGPRMLPLAQAVKTITQKSPLPRHTKMLIDINPISTYF